MATAFANQLTNRNFLSPAGFQFQMTKEPKVSFFCTSATIPELSFETTVQPSYLKDIDVPGEKIQFADLRVRFLVDEDLKNYMAIHNWITGIGYPETAQDFKTETTDASNIWKIINSGNSRKDFIKSYSLRNIFSESHNTTIFDTYSFACYVNIKMEILLAKYQMFCKSE